jgi:two-component sensor histidine kinase
MASEQSKSSVWDVKHLSVATEAAGVTFWSWNVDTDNIIMDDHGCDLWGVPRSEQVTFEALSAHIHPADRDRVRAAFAATRGVLGAYEIDFRTIFGGEIRWISARGKGDDEGMRDRTMFGIFLDVTGRKQAEEANELLSGEMSHRVKNLLHIASALAEQTSRKVATTADMARDLTHRLTALGRAHDLVRPVPGQEKKEAFLGDLLMILLAPYDDLGDFQGRVRVSVPKMGVGENAATTLALVVHELATNSLKYGALSAPSGTLDVSCAADAGKEVLITWTERGGPSVVAPKAPAGFGSKMITRGMSDQLGGSLAFDWSKEGVIVTLRMNKDRLAG